MSDNRIKAMRSSLFYVDVYRDRAKALDYLGSLLACEAPGTKNEVHVKGWRWWRKPEYRANEEEIVLSDDERREFRDWCKERAEKLRKQADDLELSVATGGRDV